MLYGRTVLWDVDGVLIWHHPTDPTQDWRCPLAERGYLNLWEAFQQSGLWQGCLTDPARGDVREAFPAFLQDAGVSGVDHEWIICRWLEDNLRPHKPALECLKGMDKAGLTCAIATNQDALRTECLRAWLAVEGLGHLPFFASCELGASKPDPRFFESLQKRLDGNPVTFLDDVLENVAAARQAGWAAHHVTSAFEWSEFHRETADA